MVRRFLSTPLLALALLAGCGRRGESGPIEVAVIGAAPDPARPAAPDRGPIDAPAAVLAGATAQGLLRFDAGGQLIPGLAARWIVSDTGRSLIFRLPDGAAPGPPAISAEKIARRLRAAIAPGSRNPLKPLLGAVTDIDAVTPQVVDIELGGPRPNLLQLFAQPELGGGAGRGGGGPFEIVARRPDGVILRERTDPQASPDRAAQTPAIVPLRGAPAGRAVARFLGGREALVLGGRFTDLPVARAATLPRGALRFDPVGGLFGLAFVATDAGPTALPEARRALAMAIDRDRIAGLLGVPGWTPTTAIVPRGTPEIATPAAPPWGGNPVADRQTEARRVIAGLAAKDRPRAPLRVAMPDGPGARLLFAAIAADWRTIGVAAIAVPTGAPAELRLIDAVAPADTAAFYLRRFACEEGLACDPATDALLLAARATPSLAERSALFAQADQQMAATVPFIALGSPVRWSLVARDLDLYRDSPRAIHPLNELRTPSKR